ncbi:molybdenum cofactor guanylyltransferase [Aeromicrobium sp. UC242_57]|uniref:molybdenum cofactor guanylyltransferase n=1 Tax=Aeromicrobium sp. UC242_57 TaxID=3374624 RepID=UPI0037959B1F
MIAFDAIVLAGGRSRRMGDVDKIGVLLQGRPLLAHACDAVAAARSLVVVGPDGLAGTPAGAQVTRSTRSSVGRRPPSAQGWTRWPIRRQLVAVIAADVPRAADAIPALLAAALTAADGVVARQGNGWLQPLLAVYRTASLLAAVDAHAPLTGLAVHRLVGGLDLAELTLPDDVLSDVDTPDDLHRLTTSTKEQPHG